MSFQHFNFTDPDEYNSGATGGVKNFISVDEAGVLVTQDVQDGKVLDIILDANAQARNHFPLGNPQAYGRLVGRIPIVIWQNWRREWDEKYRQYWTWHTFEVMKLNSRDFNHFKTVNDNISVPENVRTTGQ